MKCFEQGKGNNKLVTVRIWKGVVNFPGLGSSQHKALPFSAFHPRMFGMVLQPSHSMVAI